MAKTPNAPTATKSSARRPRRAAAGDTVLAKGNDKGNGSLDAQVVAEAVQAAQGAKIAAVQDLLSRAAGGDALAQGKQLRAILDGASPDDAAA